MEIETIIAIISSLGVGSIVGSYLQKKANDKNNFLKYITEERRKWREKIRDLIPQLRDNKTDENKIKKITSELQLRLNPGDPRDKYILKKLKELAKKEKEKKNLIDEEKENLIDEIEESVSHLLKHDWERVKIESAPFRFNPLKTILFSINFLITYSLIQFIIKRVTNWSLSNLPDLLWGVFCFIIIFSILYILLNWFYDGCIIKKDSKFINGLKKYSNIPIREGTYDKQGDKQTSIIDSLCLVCCIIYIVISIVIIIYSLYLFVLLIKHAL